jgi:DNA repair protein RecN (Recombination protein N)
LLHELHITDLGVIGEVDLELASGLTVLTGETGAGKTMVAVALGLALGERGGGHLVRPGAARARVEARFDAPATPAAAEWSEDGELVLARTVPAEGRSTGRIGGQLVPVSALASLAPDLVELHGQGASPLLRSAAAQTAFLDRFAGRDHLELVARYAEAYARLRRVGARLEELAREARDREREKDLLGYQVREIEGAGVRPGELAGIEAEAARLSHAERLTARAAEAEDALGTDRGGADALATAAAALADAAGLDRGAGEVAARARSLAEEAADLTREVRGYRETVEADPGRLSELQERLAALRALERKYGDGEEGILAYLRTAAERLAGLAGADDERQGLEAEHRDLEGSCQRLAGEVSRGRAERAPVLAGALTAELAELGMQGARVVVDLAPEAGLGAHGHEGVELRFSGGPGQPPAPLGKVASGGELSRVMLACRSVLADLDDVPTLVFDEVDAGIGGRAGMAVGRRLARLSRSRQVLVVTHLPQIACFADRHVLVAKVGGRAAVSPLDGAARVTELSRMLSGMPGSDAAATHAEELLAEAAALRSEAERGPDAAVPDRADVGAPRRARRG